MQRVPPELKANARALRTGATEAERLLWFRLRTHRPRFTRQLVVGHYIVDIACRSACVAVELDGGHHLSQDEADVRRTAYLEAQGWTVLRFWNVAVVENPNGVAESIIEAVARVSTHPQPLPFQGGELKRRTLPNGGHWTQLTASAPPGTLAR